MNGQIFIIYHLSKTLAKERGVAVNINKCNPLAGDPADCYDVDFLPVGTGKDEIVRFMLNQYDLSKDQGFAFGDSGNDLRMLQSVTHGFLVQNATAEAKRHHHQICHHGYAKGIYETLKTVMYKHEEAHS
ncbi:hypothetical protein BsIDN1_05520 [Bacillus safensis]|uniref:Sucrose phosphatase-like domain-containing protein n=1 Tax=Bacillus safensis TaxID=561879 RepID=A0A5S9M456_BACIA|nr:hypothetical protein BsIDN1_05520 [Bacillus safensis]